MEILEESFGKHHELTLVLLWTIEWHHRSDVVAGGKIYPPIEGIVVCLSHHCCCSYCFCWQRCRCLLPLPTIHTPCTGGVGDAQETLHPSNLVSEAAAGALSVKLGTGAEAETLHFSNAGEASGIADRRTHVASTVRDIETKYYNTGQDSCTLTR